MSRSNGMRWLSRRENVRCERLQGLCPVFSCAMFLMSNDAGSLCKPYVCRSKGGALVVPKDLNVRKLLLDQVEAATQVPADDGRKTRDVLLSKFLLPRATPERKTSKLGANAMLLVVVGKEGRGV